MAMVGFGNSFAVTELALSQRQLAMTAKKSAPFDTYEYIKEVAASLHQTDKTGLKIVSDHADGILDSMVLPSGVKLREQQIEFASLAVRNQLAAEYYFDKNKRTIGTSSDVRWLNVCHDIWSKDDHSSSDTVSGRLLAILDRYFETLQLAATSLKQENVFDFLLPAAASLPHLDKISVDQLYLFCSTQDELTKRDYFRGYFFQKLSLALASRIDVAREIIRRQQQDTSEKTVNLYMAASSAIASVSPKECAKYILGDSQSKNSILSSAAVQITGSLIRNDRLDQPTNQDIANIITSSLESSDALVRESALVAVAASAQKTSEFDSHLLSLVNNGDSKAAYFLAQILSQDLKSCSRKKLAEETLSKLCKIISLSNRDSTYLDMLLENMLTDSEQYDTVINGLEHWILAPSQGIDSIRDFVKDLNGTVARIISNPELLSRLLTSWLIHDDLRIPLAASNILSHAFQVNNKKDMNLSFMPEEIESLDLPTFELLAYRTIAFVNKAENQVSLILSLVPMRYPTTLYLEVIRHILVNDLGYDYPGLVIVGLDEIKTSAAPKAVKDLCDQVVTQLKTVIELRRKLPYRKELEPPSSIVRSFEKQRAAEIYSAFKQSEADSVFLKIVTKIPVKAGKQVFNFQQLPLDQAMNLNEIAVTYTVPRSLFSDPLGLEIRRYFYKSLKKDPE